MHNDGNIVMPLKFKKINHDKIGKDFDYPIKSFLNGYGIWTYSDTDYLVKNYHSFACNDALREKPKNYDETIEHNVGRIPFNCENNGKICYIFQKDKECAVYKKYLDNEYNPSIKPVDLLNVSTWAKIYYYQKGKNEADEWIVVCQNNDGVFIYFRASCDYTGFECQGGGEISYSKNENVFWNHCLDNLGRMLLLKENGVEMKITFK